MIFEIRKGRVFVRIYLAEGIDTIGVSPPRDLAVFIDVAFVIVKLKLAVDETSCKHRWTFCLRS